MTSQDLSVIAPSSSASSTDGRLLAVAQAQSRIVAMPYKILLDLILDDLGIPKAEYHLELSDDREFLIKIQLKASKIRTQVSLSDMWISGIWSSEYREAEDSASMQAIRYIEKHAGVVIRDVNYGHLKDLEDQNKDLKYRLNEAEQHNNKLARGWFLAVRNMHSFSQQMHSIVLLNYSLQESPVDELWNALLCNIADMGFRLKNIGLDLEERLEKMLNRC